MNDLTGKRLTTKRAAEIAGMGYEGLRTCLKRGLLKHTGMLLPFVARGQPAPDLDAKRWSWKEFGLSDICMCRLAKILMDAGLPFEHASHTASREDLWQFFWGNYFLTGSVAIQYLVVSITECPSECLYTKDQLISDLNNGVLSVNAGHVLVDLIAVHEAVMAALSTAPTAEDPAL